MHCDGHFKALCKDGGEGGQESPKKVMEKGWFGRGNMLMVTGFRRDDQFVSKTYKSTDSHQLYKIDEVCGDQIKIRNERWTAADAFEEEDYE